MVNDLSTGLQKADLGVLNCLETNISHTHSLSINLQGWSRNPQQRGVCLAKHKISGSICHDSVRLIRTNCHDGCDSLPEQQPFIISDRLHLISFLLIASLKSRPDNRCGDFNLPEHPSLQRFAMLPWNASVNTNLIVFSQSCPNCCNLKTVYTDRVFFPTTS